MKKKKGFTLVELIAVIAISAIFGSIVIAISITSGRLFSKVQTDSLFNDKGRLIIGWVEDDLRTGYNVNGTNDSLVNSYDGYGLSEGFPGACKVVLDLKVKKMERRKDIYIFIKIIL